MECTTIDVLPRRAFGGAGGATAMDHHNVKRCQTFRAVTTAGTIIGVIEMRAQKLWGSSAKDVPMNTAGVDGVIVMDRQFAVKLNQELSNELDYIEINF